METEGISLRGVRQAITEHIQNGVLDNRVINALVCQDEFIPKECELWDYKRDIASDVISLTKTILRVVSFHNTYGGYLIYGVDEVVKDIKFVPVGISQGSLDLQQLRQHLANYTGEQIDISYAEITCDISNNSFLLGLLHVPKRPHPKTPTFLVRDGPK